MATTPTLSGLFAAPRLRAELVQHARRGLRIQLALRGVLVLFVAGTVALVPPTRDAGWCWLVIGCYAVAGIVTGGWMVPGGLASLRWGWLVLFMDLTALLSLTLLAGRSAAASWTLDVVVNGFFLLPLLATTQLSPLVCAAVVAPTDLAYLAAGVATRAANEEPLASVLLRTAALVGLSVGCIALSWLQRSRVLTIGSLLGDRLRLLADLVDLESRERRQLSEQLHDGALQYVLAARMDLDDLRDGGDPAAVERIERALTESSALLRATVGQLYPAVLQRAGLPEALQQAAAAAAARGGFGVSVEASDWPAGVRTTADAVVYAAARELLSNVAKHANASIVQVTISLTGGVITLTVTDDGMGIDEGELGRKLRAGHIGVASQQARIAAAGGELKLARGRDGGTIATVTVPATFNVVPAR